MTPHPYLYEKLITERHTQILHDIQLSRRQALFGQRRSLTRSIVGSFGTLLIDLGYHLQQSGQKSGTSLHAS